jgi:hypothetical protein
LHAGEAPLDRQRLRPSQLIRLASLGGNSPQHVLKLLRLERSGFRTQRGGEAQPQEQRTTS